MPNKTMEKFGYPKTLVAQVGVWSALVRPKQATLGALVLVADEPAQSFPELSTGAYADLRLAVAGVEKALKSFVKYERINYLMLMMVDPDVHFHVIPRYDGDRTFSDRSFPDSGWPGPPNLAQGVDLEGEALGALTAAVKSHWNAA